MCVCMKERERERKKESKRSSALPHQCRDSFRRIWVSIQRLGLFWQYVVGSFVYFHEILGFFNWDSLVEWNQAVLIIHRALYMISRTLFIRESAAKEISLKLRKPLGTKWGDLVPLEGLSFRDLRKLLSATNFGVSMKIFRWHCTFDDEISLLENVKCHHQKWNVLGSFVVGSFFIETQKFVVLRGFGKSRKESPSRGTRSPYWGAFVIWG